MYKRVISFVITVSLTFVLFFVGYLQPKFDIFLNTDNIVGEGQMTVYRTPYNTLSQLYSVSGYFGSLLEITEINEFNYDTEELRIEISGVEKCEIISCDVSVFGISTGHYTGADMGNNMDATNQDSLKAFIKGNRLLFEFDDPSLTYLFIFKGIDFIPTWFWVIYWIIFGIITIVLSFGTHYLINRHPKSLFQLLSLSMILTTLLLGCCINGSYPYVEYVYFFFNWAILIAICMLISALTLPWLGTILGTGITLFWYCANYFLINYRKKPIMPADLKAAGTAKEVISGYSLTPTIQMVISMLIWIVFAVCLIGVYKKRKEVSEKVPLKNNLIRRGITTVIACAVLFFSVNNPVYKTLDTFAWDVVLLKDFHNEGMILTFLKSELNSIIKKPEGYSKEEVDNYYVEYSKDEERKEGIQPTNIIMIMNEAFSDLRDSGMDNRIDVMPFVDSLKENTISGSLYVSVLAGGTCNTEFEALTGNNLAFLPAGAYPYTDMINSEMFSLATYFDNLNYYTAAMHPQEALNWNRNNVYPYFGFKDFYDIDAYEEFGANDTVQFKTTDKSNYNFLNNIDKQNSNKSRFLFNVTLQNHAGYDDWDDLEEADSIKNNIEIPTRDIRVYLSLIKMSDDAIKELVEYYESINEPTMIVFFGDHQPGLNYESYPYVYMGNAIGLNMYKSDFFIWTNYETEPIEDLQISANYLPYLILERGSFELPPYIKMLKDLYEEYPVISSQGVIDKNGNVYTGVDAIDDPLIKKYQYIQYANMFDEINDDWFRVK